MSLSLSRLYQYLKQSIVSIEGMKQKRQQRQHYFFPFNMPEETQERNIRYGSGMIINPQGYILSCYHVVAGMDVIKIKLGSEKSVYQAKLIWSDSKKDIAIIKIDPHKRLQAVKFASSKQTPIGEKVLAIGNPFGFEHTLTMGVLSGKDRRISTESHEYKVVLQTDAALNPGNSGGPLFDSKGRVIGMNAVIIQSFQNMGFAIPSQEFINDIRRFLPSKKRS